MQVVERLSGVVLVGVVDTPGDGGGGFMVGIQGRSWGHR